MRTPGGSATRYAIGCLDAALTVLESFVDARTTTPTLSEVCRQVGMGKNRVFRILATLEARGYVQRDARTQTYRLGLTLLRLGQEVQHRLDLQGTAQPILADLARQTGEVAHLIVRQGDHAMCVAHHGASRMLQAFDTVGAPIPLHVGASPKMLLAYAPEDEREQLIKTIRFQRFTPNTIASTKALRKHLDRIVALGYSLDEEDFEAGVCAAGAPVRDHLGHVAAGVTITVPSSRFGPADQARLIRAVRQAAARVSQRLGWQPNRTAADAGRDASEPTPLRAVTVGARTRS